MKNGKTYRIKANPGNDSNINISLDQNYDSFEILSLKIDNTNDYKLHSSNYGVVVGRAIANDGVGVPNAKVSIFVALSDEDEYREEIKQLYPYNSFVGKDDEGRRYNVLPNYSVDKCHQPVGSMPSKEYILDNGITLEIMEKYLKFSTRTNESGDYMLTGIPVGQQSIHMDLDLSDCGMLSQRPRDFLYKGYNIEQFESPNQFKKGTNLDSLSQIMTHNATIDVIPFWGNEEVSPKIGITRFDIPVYYKFEPTCVFMGSLVGDGMNGGISEKCIPNDSMGLSEELMATGGEIEIIRKNIYGETEPFQVKGTEVIDGNGVWCFQIPMNLDYKITDEYGRLVHTDDPTKGIPTRARVRFRVSMKAMDANNEFYYRSKVLVPNNPQSEEEMDYNFGSLTKDTSYRDLFWDNVYTVKSYIPRLQKRRDINNLKYTGIKGCNRSGNNNPIPYNNIRIKMPFMFSVTCILIKIIIFVVKATNWTMALFTKLTASKDKIKENFMYNVISGEYCPELENWYFCPTGKIENRRVDLLKLTLEKLKKQEGEDAIDPTSIDYQNNDQEYVCITQKDDYFLSCLEMNLAEEYKVISFDFYNDWINGVLYFPRWVRKVRKKRNFLFGIIRLKEKVRGCMDDPKIFRRNRRYVQQCALSYNFDNQTKTYTTVKTPFGCTNKNGKKMKCHKPSNAKGVKVFGSEGGIVHENINSRGLVAYYMKPCEFKKERNRTRKINFFATDIVLLGSLKECNPMGLPMAFMHLSGTSYKMPSALALTNMDENANLYEYTNTGKGGKGNRSLCTTSATMKNLVDKDTGDILTEIKETDSSLDFTTLNSLRKDKLGNDIDEFSKYDDVYRTTEASGIAWNYEGPGQKYTGNDDKDKRTYNPGGHFVGVSCIASQTNVKSCVNLSRICEQGVDMSSRHRGFRGVDEEKKELKYYYTIPNGLISKDDISDSDFRSMFATMNSHRLIGRVNRSEVEYPLEYLAPKNFNGEMRQFIGEGTYNAHIDRNDILSEKDSLNAGEEASDHDIEEGDYTYRRSIEETDLDYYRFRFGLNSEKKNENFALVENGSYSLPQYENSFYFYFGLSYGNTAIDKLKREFFSICKGEEKLEPEIMVEINYKAESPNYALMNADINIKIAYAIPPFTIEYWNVLCPEDKTSIDGANNVFDINGIPFGDYKMSIKDAFGKTKEISFTVGMEKIKVDITDVQYIQTLPINVTNNESKIRFPNTGNDADRKSVGGYIFLNNIIEYNDEKYSFSNQEWNDFLFAVVSRTDRTYIYFGDERLKDDFLDILKNGNLYESIECIGRNIWNSWSDGEFPDRIYINLWGEDDLYDVYIGRKSRNNGLRILLVDRFKFYGRSSVEMYQGTEILPFTKCLDHLSPKWRMNLKAGPYFVEDYQDVVCNNFKERYPILSNSDSRYVMNILQWVLRKVCIKTSINEEDDFNSNVFYKLLNENTSDSINASLIGCPEKYDGQEDKYVLKKDESGNDVMCVTDFPYDYEDFNLSINPSHIPTSKDINGIFNDVRPLFGTIFGTNNKISMTPTKIEAISVEGGEDEFKILNAKIKSKYWVDVPYQTIWKYSDEITNKLVVCELPIYDESGTNYNVKQFYMKVKDARIDENEKDKMRFRVFISDVVQNEITYYDEETEIEYTRIYYYPLIQACITSGNAASMNTGFSITFNVKFNSIGNDNGGNQYNTRLHNEDGTEKIFPVELFFNNGNDEYSDVSMLDFFDDFTDTYIESFDGFSTNIKLSEAIKDDRIQNLGITGKLLMSEGSMQIFAEGLDFSVEFAGARGYNGNVYDIIEVDDWQNAVLNGNFENDYRTGKYKIDEKNLSQGSVNVKLEEYHKSDILTSGNLDELRLYTPFYFPVISGPFYMDGVVVCFNDFEITGLPDVDDDNRGFSVGYMFKKRYYGNIKVNSKNFFDENYNPVTDDENPRKAVVRCNNSFKEYCYAKKYSSPFHSFDFNTNDILEENESADNLSLEIYEPHPDSVLLEKLDENIQINKIEYNGNYTFYDFMYKYYGKRGNEPEGKLVTFGTSSNVKYYYIDYNTSYHSYNDAKNLYDYYISDNRNNINDTAFNRRIYIYQNKAGNNPGWHVGGMNDLRTDGDYGDDLRHNIKKLSGVMYGFGSDKVKGTELTLTKTFISDYDNTSNKFKIKNDTRIDTLDGERIYAICENEEGTWDWKNKNNAGERQNMSIMLQTALESQNKLNYESGKQKNNYIYNEQQGKEKEISELISKIINSNEFDRNAFIPDDELNGNVAPTCNDSSYVIGIAERGDEMNGLARIDAVCVYPFVIDRDITLN